MTPPKQAVKAKHKKKRRVLGMTLLSAMAIELALPIASAQAADNFLFFERQDNDNQCATPIDDDSSGSLGEAGEASGEIPNAENIKPIYEYMNGEWGLSAEMIAGILGNWVKESGINPIVVQNHMGSANEETAKANTGNSSLGIGLGQWTAGRHDQLVAYAKSKNKNWWDLEIQLKFMFEGEDPAWIEIIKKLALNANDDPAENAVAFHNEWERSADSRDEVLRTRGAEAKKVYEYMKKNGMTGKADKNKINKLGGSWTGVSTGIIASTDSSSGEERSSCGPSNYGDGEVAEIAMKYIGWFPYSQPLRTELYNDRDNPKKGDHTDCSGFVWHVFYEAGYKIPEYVWWTGSIRDDLASDDGTLEEIKAEDTQAGDMVFVHQDDPSQDHAAILLEPWHGKNTAIIQSGGGGANNPNGQVNVSVFNWSNEVISDPNPIVVEAMKKTGQKGQAYNGGFANKSYGLQRFARPKEKR